MKKYPLQAFLRVCKMREEQSQRDLAKARAATVAAIQELQRAQKKHEHCKKIRPTKEKELFAAIKGDAISQKRLDAFHLDVKALLNEELDLAKAEADAANYVRQMQAQEETAQAHWQEATKEHAKITEHHAIWNNTQKRIQEKAEEAEMEGE